MAKEVGCILETVLLFAALHLSYSLGQLKLMLIIQRVKRTMGGKKKGKTRHTCGK